MTKVLVACGVIGAFGLGWIINDAYAHCCVRLALNEMLKDGYVKFGETINGVFNDLPIDECVRKFEENLKRK